MGGTRVNVGAPREEQLDNRLAAPCSGEVQWRPIVLGRGVHIDPLLQDGRDGLDAAGSRGEMQGSHSPLCLVFHRTPPSSDLGPIVHEDHRFRQVPQSGHADYRLPQGRRDSFLRCYMSARMRAFICTQRATTERVPRRTLG